MFFSAQNMTELLIYTLSGLIGTVGYTLINRMRLRRIALASLGGALSVAVWFVCLYFTDNVFLSNLAGAFVVTVYSEIMARVCKAPATIFLVPGIIPLVPGGRLYYTMAALVSSDMEGFRQNGFQTVEIALGIAVGIVLVSTIFSYIRSLRLEKLRGGR